MEATKNHLSFSVDNTVPASRFIASLSDGTTVYENHLNDPTLRTPWMRLKDYLKRTGLKITRMRFQGVGETHNIPVADAYMVFYQANTGLAMGPEHFTCIGTYDKTSGRLRVLFFNYLGAYHHEEMRDEPPDHPALIFTE